MFGVQNNSEKGLLGICFYYCAKLERHFAVALYTNMTVSSRVKTKNTNKILHKMGKTTTPLCSFCGRSNESLEHLFICCEFACSFWLSVTNWLEGMVCM